MIVLMMTTIVTPPPRVFDVGKDPRSRLHSRPAPSSPWYGVPRISRRATRESLRIPSIQQILRPRRRGTGSLSPGWKSLLLRGGLLGRGWIRRQFTRFSAAAGTAFLHLPLHRRHLPFRLFAHRHDARLHLGAGRLPKMVRPATAVVLFAGPATPHARPRDAEILTFCVPADLLDLLLGHLRNTHLPDTLATPALVAAAVGGRSFLLLGIGLGIFRFGVVPLPASRRIWGPAGASLRPWHLGLAFG